MAELPAQPVDPPIQLVLRPEWSLNGTVLGPLDRSVGPGFSVVAVRRDSAPRPESFASGRRGNSWVCVEAKADGRFEIRGLDRGQSYRLLAWGPGYIPDSSREMTSGADGPSGAVAKVIPVYGCLFKFSDASNGNVRTSELLTILTGLGYKHPSGYEAIDSTWPFLKLAKVPEPLLVPPGPDRLPILLVPAEEREVVDSLSGVGASLKLPGYEPRQFEGVAPLAVGACTEYEVKLIPRSSSFGSIRITLTHFPTITEDDLRTLACEKLIGVVMLANPTDVPFAIAIRPDCGGAVSVAGVPAGTYRVWFRDTFEFFHSPPLGQELIREVVADRETALDFDLPPHGQLVFFTPDGAGPESDPLGVEMAVRRGPEVTNARHDPYFAHLPGALLFLPAAQYQIKSRGAYKLGPERLGDIEVDVPSGQRITLEVSKGKR